MNIYNRERENYKKLNSVANSNGVVLIGSSFAKEIPVCELRQTFQLNCDVYNRSYTDLSVFDAKDLVSECINELKPQRVLLNLGETDLERGFRSVPEIVTAYESLLLDLKKQYKNCRFVIVSICDSEYTSHPGELNRQLEALAKRHKCQYADITSAKKSTHPSITAFDMLRLFMLDKVSLGDVLLANA